jgi:hypothetical protein
MQKNNGLFGCGAMRVAVGLSKKKERLNILWNGDFSDGDLTGWSVTNNVGVVLIDQNVSGNVLNVAHLQNDSAGALETTPEAWENLFLDVGLSIGDTCNLLVSFWFKSSNDAVVPLVTVFNVLPPQIQKQASAATGADWTFCQMPLYGLTVTAGQLKIRLETLVNAKTWYAGIKVVRI